MMALTRTDARRRSDELQVRLIYLATLPACLCAVALARLVRSRARAGASRSILGEAKVAARTCGSFALMG